MRIGPITWASVVAAVFFALLGGCVMSPYHGPADLIECPQCHAMVPHASLHEHTVEMHGHRPAEPLR